MFHKSSLSVFVAVLGVVLLTTALGFAQIPVTGNPSVGQIPVITTSGSDSSHPTVIGNSGITQLTNGNVGIGTAAPAALLNLVGANPTMRIDNYSNNTGDSPNFNFNTARGTLASPSAILSGDNLGQFAAAGYNGAAFPGSKVKVTFIATENWTPTANGTAMSFQTTPNGTTARAERMRIDNTGFVGIGTTTPGEMLEVSGNVKLSGTGSHITFPDGSVQSLAWTGSLCGGDYAESVDVSGDRNHYGPGDVLVIDPDNPDGFTKSAQRYSTSVAGIYSTKPGVLGRKSTDSDKLKTEVPMAMIGIVPTKVSAENGPIKSGDLLVTSATLGHAMKGTDRIQMLGAVVGKALGSLNSGTGVIDVLVTLQ
jgi:ethanolamine utilization microcompartment shell protein EutS